MIVALDEIYAACMDGMQVTDMAQQRDAIDAASRAATEGFGTSSETKLLGPGCLRLEGTALDANNKAETMAAAVGRAGKAAPEGTKPDVFPKTEIDSWSSATFAFITAAQNVLE